MSIDPIPDPIGIALEWLQFASVVLLGIVSYFLKRSLNTQDDLQKEVQGLNREVTVLKTRISDMLDRDRMRRLADYFIEDRSKSEGDN